MARTPYAVRLRTRIVEVEQQIARLQSELEELRVAERVISRLGGDETEADLGASRKQGIGGVKGRTVTIATAVIDMLQRTGPVDSHTLHAKLRDEWRKDLGFTTLSSTLSRMKRAGQVYSDGRLWFHANPHRDEGSGAKSAAPADDPAVRPDLEVPTGGFKHR